MNPHGGGQGRSFMARAMWVAMAIVFATCSVAGGEESDSLLRIALLQPDSLPEPEGEDGPADDVFEGEVKEGGAKGEDELDRLMSMDLDQLQDVDIVPSAITIPTGTLTATTTQADSPYTVTHITREM